MAGSAERDPSSNSQLELPFAAGCFKGKDIAPSSTIRPFTNGSRTSGIAISRSCWNWPTITYVTGTVPKTWCGRCGRTSSRAFRGLKGGVQKRPGWFRFCEGASKRNSGRPFSPELVKSLWTSSGESLTTNAEER